MPLGARFPGSGIVLPGRLGGEREDRDVGGVGGLSFGIAAEETDKGDSVEVHTFLLFCPLVSGTRKRVGAAPKARSCFSGGTGTGEPEPERCESKAEASQVPGAVKPRSSAETNGQDRNATERISILLVAAAVGTPYAKSSSIGERRSGSRRRIPRAATANAWGGNRVTTPESLAKTTGERHAHPPVRISRDPTPARRISLKKSTAKSTAERGGNASFTDWQPPLGSRLISGADANLATHKGHVLATVI